MQASEKNNEAMVKLEPLLVGKKEAARLLGLSVRTVDYLIANGELRYRRVGRRVLIPYAALRQFASRDHLRVQVIHHASASAIGTEEGSRHVED